MPKKAAVFPTIVLDGASSEPLYRQLYDRLRIVILGGQLQAETRLPSTRGLSLQLGVSRNTILAAYEQLAAEGYVELVLGSGSYVARAIPGKQFRPSPGDHTETRFARRAISQRGADLSETPRTPLPIMAGRGSSPRAFQPGLPAIDEFPTRLWGRLLARRWRSGGGLLGYQHPAGYRPLREALAAYLGAARGVRCTADQVIVVSGSQQALDLASRILTDPGDTVWMEDPGYLGARCALRAAGVKIVPIPLDSEGIRVDIGAARANTASLAVVAPSNQFPLGTTMSLARRFSLLEWANRASAWIMEDDYDSEFRYIGRPLGSLQGLDTQGRVLYFGTFSKVLFPALRLGYMVVPDDLVDAFVAGHLCSDVHSPVLTQMVVADFINDGHFVRHINRMRALYAERRRALLDAARAEVDGAIQVDAASGGMHALAWLPLGVNDQIAARALAEAGIDAWPLSLHCIEPPDRGALLLGFTAVNPIEISAAMKTLARALLGGVRAGERPRDKRR